MGYIYIDIDKYDNLTPAEYRAMFDALYNPHDPANKNTLRDIVALLKPFGATWSIGAWGKYNHGELALSLESRNALRRYYKQRDVPLSPIEIIAASGVKQVITTSDDVDVAILVGPKVHSVTLKENGHPRQTPLEKVSVTGVTRPRRVRKPRKHIEICPPVFEALSCHRERLRLSWDELQALAVELLADVSCLDKTG